MADSLDKAQLIQLVERILSGEGTEEELDAWVSLVEQNVPDPNVWNLLFFPHMCGLGDNPSAEEIVERALAYRPILL